MIADNNHRFDTWLDNLEEPFSFAETAKERFESGNFLVKREILACLGSNLILMDRKLNIKLQEPFSIFIEYGPKLKVIHNRLEPLEDQSDREVMGTLYVESEMMGERGDSNPRPPGPQPGALTN